MQNIPEVAGCLVNIPFEIRCDYTFGNLWKERRSCGNSNKKISESTNSSHLLSFSISFQSLSSASSRIQCRNRAISKLRVEINVSATKYFFRVSLACLFLLSCTYPVSSYFQPHSLLDYTAGITKK